MTSRAKRSKLYRLEHHPEFLRRIAAAREALKSGRGVRLEDLPTSRVAVKPGRARRLVSDIVREDRG